MFCRSPAVNLFLSTTFCLLIFNALAFDLSQKVQPSILAHFGEVVNNIFAAHLNSLLAVAPPRWIGPSASEAYDYSMCFFGCARFLAEVGIKCQLQAPLDVSREAASVSRRRITH